MVAVYVGVGSNIDQIQNIKAAIKRLGQLFGPLRLSPVYQTPAYGFEGPAFHNLVIGFQTELPAKEVYWQLRQIEAEQNRERSGETFDSRTLDLDLLLYGDQEIQDDHFTVPHADIMRYSFVLKPLIELAPELPYPGTGESIKVLWERFDNIDQSRLVNVSDQYQIDP